MGKQYSIRIQHTDTNTTQTKHFKTEMNIMVVWLVPSLVAQVAAPQYSYRTPADCYRIFPKSTFRTCAHIAPSFLLMLLLLLLLVLRLVLRLPPIVLLPIYYYVFRLRKLKRSKIERLHHLIQTRLQ